MGFQEKYRHALKNLPEGVRWAEVNIKRTEGTIVVARNGEFGQASVENSDGAYVRAAITGEGMAYSQDLGQDPAALILQAAENGLFSQTVHQGESLARAVMVSCPQLHPSMPVHALFSAAQRICQLAKQRVDGLTGVTCTLREDSSRSYVMNSLGTDVQTANRVYTCQLELVVEQQNTVINESSLVTAKSLSELDISTCIQEAETKIQEQLLPSLELEAGTYPAVLDHSVMSNILITAWQLFSASKYIGKTSAFSGLLGQRVASSAVTVVDRECHPACGYQYSFDDEASRGSDHVLMDRGLLSGLLQTRLTAQQLGVSPTGNAGRVALLTGSIPTALIPIPRILTIEPGDQCRRQLLKDMGDGLLIPYSFDIFHSINISNGDFSIPCRTILVKGGEMVGQCSNLTMSGNLRDLLLAIDEMGNDLTIQPFLLRSYCYGAPSARVKQLTIG